MTTRKVLVSPQLTELKTGNADLDRKLNEWLRANQTHLFNRLLYLLKYAPDHELAGAEISAGVTPTNYQYPPGDLRRYGADTTGAADSTDAFNNCLACNGGGTGHVYHPGGTIALDTSTINDIPNGITIAGEDMTTAIFSFTGDGSGFTNSNGPNSSGFGRVYFRNFTMTGNDSTNNGAGINLEAGGYSHYGVDRVRIVGFKYGVILDQAEIARVNKCVIETSVSGGIGGVWIVNGNEWRGSSVSLGFSNVIQVTDNQLSGGSYNIVDDGGNAHRFSGNNCDGASVSARFSGVSGLTLDGSNSFETHDATGDANVLFDTYGLTGNPKGPCTGFSIRTCGFFGDMDSGSCLVFRGHDNTITGISKASSAVVTVSTAGSVNPFLTQTLIYFSGVSGMTEINGKAGWVTAVGGSSGAWTATVNIDSSGFTTYSSGGVVAMMHSGGEVAANTFGWVLGRGAAIDVDYLANSFCGHNLDMTQSAGASHYTNVNTGRNANTLLPPANGFAGGSVGIDGALIGDTRNFVQFPAAVRYTRIVVPYSASISLDMFGVEQGNHYDITATNSTNFTINSPSNVADGMRVAFTIRNTSGGALGTLTWGPSFKLAGSWTQPATGTQRSIEFLADNGGIFHELSRTAADVTN